jgi:hypothetical protein
MPIFIRRHQALQKHANHAQPIEYPPWDQRTVIVNVHQAFIWIMTSTVFRVCLELIHKPSLKPHVQVVTLVIFLTVPNPHLACHVL